MKYLGYISFFLLFVSCESKKIENNPKKDFTHGEVTEKDTILSAKTNNPIPFLGESAQIVIGTQNYNETVEFYTLLGWKEQVSASAEWKWTKLFDGSTVLMINEDTTNYMGIGYNAKNASEVYEKLESDGISPLISVNKPTTDKTWFNVYAAPDSIGFSVVNETIKMPETENAGTIFASSTGTKFGFPNPIVGSFQEFAVSVENLDNAIAYWEKLGFKSNGINTDPYSYTIMYDGFMILGLHETKGMWYGTSFTYSGHGVEQNKVALKTLQDAGFAKGIEAMKYGEMILEGNFLIPDPADNMFMLTTDLTGLKK